MKKAVLLLAAVVSLSSFGLADENTAPVEAAATEESSGDKDEGLYLGLAYTHLSHDLDAKHKTTVTELDYSALSLQVGYKFNLYIAVEGRYGMTFGDPDASDRQIEDDSEITVWGIYAKPMYPVAPEFDIYALLGFAGTNATGSFHYNGMLRSFDVDETGLSWGVGGTYAITEEISVFADYLLFYDDSSVLFDKVIDSFNFGVSYQF